MLNLVLAIVTLLNALWRFLDERQRSVAARKLAEAAHLKVDLEAIAHANDARSSLERELRDDPDRVRAADADARTGPGG